VASSNIVKSTHSICVQECWNAATSISNGSDFRTRGTHAGSTKPRRSYTTMHGDTAKAAILGGVPGGAGGSPGRARIAGHYPPRQLPVDSSEEARLPLGILPTIMGLFMLELPSNPRRTALAIAILADAVQIVFFPMFVEGAASPLDDLLDIAIAWMLIRLLGWHWAFLPSFVAKVVPGVDLVPTWTMAVLVATRRMPSEQAKIEPPIIEGRP